MRFNLWTIVLLVYFIVCSVARGQDVELSCFAPSNLPISITNGVIPFGSSFLLIAESDGVTVVDTGNIGDKRYLEWDDEIIGAVTTSNGAIVISKSTIIQFDELGRQKEMHRFQPPENETVVENPYAIDEVELLWNDTVLIRIDGHAYMFRTRDRKSLYLGRSELIRARRNLFDEQREDLLLVSADTQQLVDVENLVKFDLPHGSVSSASVVGGRIVFHFQDITGYHIGILERTTGKLVTVPGVGPIEHIIYGQMNDRTIVFGTAGQNLTNFYKISLDPVAIERIDGANGLFGNTDRGLFWYIAFADAIQLWNDELRSFQPLEGLPHVGLSRIYPIERGRLLVESQSGFYLANIEKRTASMLADSQYSIMHNGSDSGVWVFASPEKLLVFDPIREDIIELNHQLGTVVQVKMASNSVGYAMSNDRVARFDINERALIALPSGRSIMSSPLNPDVFVLHRKGEKFLAVHDEAGFREIRLPSGFSGDEVKSLRGGIYYLVSSREMVIVDSTTMTVERVSGRNLSDARLFGTKDDGYFVYADENPSKVVIRAPFQDKVIANKKELEKLPPQAVPVELMWQFKHPCRTQLANFEPVLRVTADQKNDPVETDLHISRRENEGGWVSGTANVEFTRAGIWAIDVVADVHGENVVIASDQLHIAFSWWGVVQEWWRLIAVVASCLYVITFLALFILARFKAWPLRVVADPVWSKVAVWPFFVLRHSANAQRWVFAPYFQNMKQSKVARAVQYHPVAATSADNRNIDASELLDEIKKVQLIWMQGGPGMGKSLIFSKWLYRYFSATNLSVAAKEYGGILIPILVRDFADLPEKPEQRSDWFIEVIRRHLRAHDLYLDDTSLIRSMLLSGHFILALDGLNEADRDGALAEFVAAYPSVRIIATCQSLPTDDFSLWSLPKTIQGQIKGLLKLWQGDELGHRIYLQLEDEGIIEFLASGYDVRLISDLAKRSPELIDAVKSRIELYELVLQLALDDAGERLDMTTLMRTAWQMLLDGRRHLSPEDCIEIGEMALERLSAEGVRILRKLADRREFRHDQMRAFLASWKLIKEAPAIEVVIERLEENAVWLCSKKDQEELWKFVADLVDVADLPKLWQAMLSDPARAWAQTALLARAKRDGIVLEVNIAA